MKTNGIGVLVFFSAALFSACGGLADTDGGATPGVIGEAVSPAKKQCVETVLCVAGSHFDTTLCRCVPDTSNACISKEGGPCGGFTQDPCRCAAGLTCVPNAIPDIPGTCEPTRCCPSAWDMYSCKEASGGTGFNCHDPALGCASSLTCGGGCDFEVSGRCPVCDPIVCPAGQIFSRELCKCVGCVTAADCTGPLPDSCRVCADGSAGCAHWACVAGACDIATCN